MDAKEYIRKPMPVTAVQVTLQNVEEVAEWCKGTVALVSTRMLGTKTDLPAIKIQGTGDNRGKEFTATLGCFVVEHKGNFRVYKPAQFNTTFDEAPEKKTEEDQNQPDLWTQNDDHTSQEFQVDETVRIKATGMLAAVRVLGVDKFGRDGIEVQYPDEVYDVFWPEELELV